MGSRMYSKFQYGKEAANTHGTAVAATKILAGAAISGIPTDRTPSRPQDALGIAARAVRSVIYEYLAKKTLNIPAAYFEVLPLAFSCGLKGGVTAAETTNGQGDYGWDFTPSLVSGANNAQDSITLEMGDDVQAFELEYMQFEKIRISGTIDQAGGDSPVAIDLDYFARQVTPTTFTPNLSLPTMTTINAKLARVYKDTAWAGVGGTELSNILRAFDYELITGQHVKFSGSANNYFNTVGESYKEAILTLTLEGNSDADAIFDDYQAQTARAWRMSLLGPVIGAGVANHCYLDIWGPPEMVEPLTAEASGNNLTKVLIHELYDPTGAKTIDVDVVCGVNTV